MTSNIRGDMSHRKPRHDVGVLFVHGIGSQREGATLISGGEALHEWLALWITRGKPAKGAWGAKLFQQTHGEDHPAHARMTFTTRDNEEAPLVEHNLLLAESWWAEEFIPPGFRQLMMWAFWVVPWILTEHYGRQVLRSRLQIKAASGRWHVAALLLQMVWRSVLLIAAYAAMAPLVAIVLALAIVGSIPINVLRRAVLSIQRTLTSGVGDSFVLLTSPIQEAAIMDRVRRDLEWVAGDAKKVIIVAHSQGGAIVHRLLRGLRHESELQAEIAPLPRNIEVFVSLGSGVHKLEELDASRDTAQRRKASVLPVMPTPYYGLLGFWIVAGGLFSDGTLITKAILILIGGGMLVASMWRAAHQTANFRDLTVDHHFRWLDLYAALDPVPNGAIIEAGRGVEHSEDLIHEFLTLGMPTTRPGMPRSFSISNRRSIIGDHVGYWANNEEAMAAVALAVGAAHPESNIIPADWRSRAVLLTGPKRRRFRLNVLTVSRVLIGLSVVIPGILLAARDRIDEVTKPTRELGGEAMTLIPAVDEQVLGAGWSWPAALVIGAVLAGLGYLTVSLAFSWWEKQEVRHVFRREGYTALPSPMFLTLGLAAAAAEIALFVGLERWDDLPLGAVRAAIASIFAAGLSWVAPIRLFSDRDNTEVRTQAFRNEWWTNNRTFGTAVLAFVVTFPAAVMLASDGEERWVPFALVAAGVAVTAGLAAMAPFTRPLRHLARRLTVAGEPMLRADTRTADEERARWERILVYATELRDQAEQSRAEGAGLFTEAFWEDRGRALAVDAAPQLDNAALDGDSKKALIRRLAFFDADLAISLPRDDPHRVPCLERRRTYGRWFERLAAKRVLRADG